MRLLVSVADADEAREALSGGADLIDAKDPSRGALGAVHGATFDAIVAAVGGRRPVSAALGDADAAGRHALTAAAFARAGSAFVKVGFAGLPRRSDIEAAITRTVHAVGAVAPSPAAVVAVAYADATAVNAPDPRAIIDAAAAAGAAGVLLDTADKDGPGLCACMRGGDLERWLGHARAAGLHTALAGRLSVSDVSRLAQSGADILGVRGAACGGDRRARVASAYVRQLVETIRRHDLTRHAVG